MNQHTQKIKALLITGFLASALSGCAIVQSVSLTPIPVQRSNPVRAQVSKTIILGFNFDNDFIDPLVDDLKQQCPNGIVSGILTKDETISYVFVFTKKVTATGFCSIQTAKASNKNLNRRIPGSEVQGGSVE
jgi:hypothetical protein